MTQPHENTATPTAEGVGATPDTAEPTLEQRLADAEAEVARLKDEALRARAEAENARRRAVEDVAKAHRFGIESFANSLLPVRDSLEAALAAPTPTVESLREGVEITARQLTAALEKNALVEVHPQGEKFDPHAHQAISQAPSDQPPGTVLTVVQKGYRLHDRVIRPAMVVVAAAPADAAPAAPTP